MLLASLNDGAYAVSTLAGAAPDTVTIPADWLNILIGVLLPGAVALVTRRFADSAVKALTLVALTVLTSVVTQIAANGGDFDVAPTAMVFLTQFGTAVLAHYGVLKPTGVTGTNGAIARVVEGGIGKDARRDPYEYSSATAVVDGPGDPGQPRPGDRPASGGMGPF